MKKRLMAAALILPLVLTAPVGAQGPADGRSDFRAIAGPSPLSGPQARTPYLPLADRGAGVSISSSPIIQQDGSAGLRKALVGSLAVSRGVTLGVGLIEIIEQSHKPKALRRIRPMHDTDSDTDRIAAVGLSISF